MSLLGQVIQPDASPSEDVQDMLVNGKKLQNYAFYSLIFCKNIYIDTHVYIDACTGTIYTILRLTVLLTQR